MSAPSIIAHRGASAYRPEQTAAAFELAISQGANALETDLVPTRDGILICRHDGELSLTTDVGSRPQFASRRTTKVIDGHPTVGWFVEDLTWKEISTLRAKERWSFRDHQFDGQFELLTLTDLLQLAAAAGAKSGRSIDVLLELKHPSYFASIGLAIEPLLLLVLERFGYTDSASPVIVESFEINILQQLRQQTGARLAQLIDNAGYQPFDFAAAGDPRTYADLISPAGLARIAGYAQTIGVWKRLIVPAASLPSGSTADLAPPTSLISNAHAAGLQVHAWTFRSEPPFLAASYGGNPLAEYEQFLQLGLDGFITDFPDVARVALGRPNR